LTSIFFNSLQVGTPEGTEAVIISVASEAALGAAQSAVPDAEFALLQTSSVGTFLSATLSPEQAAHLLSTLGKTVHYISCDSPVSTAQTVKPSDPVFDVYCGPDVVSCASPQIPHHSPLDSFSRFAFVCALFPRKRDG
jgi:hypothetical protein